MACGCGQHAGIECAVAGAAQHFGGSCLWIDARDGGVQVRCANAAQQATGCGAQAMEFSCRVWRVV